MAFLTIKRYPQWVATVRTGFGLSARLPGGSDRMPQVATTGLHKGSISCTPRRQRTYARRRSCSRFDPFPSCEVVIYAPLSAANRGVAGARDASLGVARVVSSE